MSSPSFAVSCSAKASEKIIPEGIKTDFCLFFYHLNDVKIINKNWNEAFLFLFS